MVKQKPRRGKRKINKFPFTNCRLILKLLHPPTHESSSPASAINNKGYSAESTDKLANFVSCDERQTYDLQFLSVHSSQPDYKVYECKAWHNRTRKREILLSALHQINAVNTHQSTRNLTTRTFLAVSANLARKRKHFLDLLKELISTRSSCRCGQSH